MTRHFKITYTAVRPVESNSPGPARMTAFHTTRLNTCQSVAEALGEVGCRVQATTSSDGATGIEWAPTDSNMRIGRKRCSMKCASIVVASWALAASRLPSN